MRTDSDQPVELTQEQAHRSKRMTGSPMRKLKEEINWKGIGDYLSAARTLQEHGTSNTCGPRLHCQGLALELALKLHLWDASGEYSADHDLVSLASQCVSVQWTTDERDLIQILNREYRGTRPYHYPARYRPCPTTVVMMVAQDNLERIVSRVISATSQPHLVERILSR